MVQKCNNPVRHYKNNTQKTCSLRKLTQIQQYHHHFKPRNAVPPPPPGAQPQCVRFVLIGVVRMLIYVGDVLCQFVFYFFRRLLQFLRRRLRSLSPLVILCSQEYRALSFVISSTNSEHGDCFFNWWLGGL
ncbi:hypothetical protein HanLR1_Chr15g0576231 [Helianthus annuus]|nr:hypothetical protein HanLR1_Chr15g0576231 [Helianthus annuus]